MNNDSEEEILRVIAATILLDTIRRKGTSISKIKKYLTKINMSLEMLLKIIGERFSKVGLNLRIVGNIDSGDALLFAVIDSSLPIDASSIDSTSAAVLSIIYLQSGDAQVSVDKVREVLSWIIRSRDQVDSILMRSLRLLSEEGLIDFDQSRQTIRLTPLGLALMPDRKLLETMILRILGEIESFQKSD